MALLENLKNWVKNRFSANPRNTGWIVFILSLTLSMYLSYTEYKLRLSIEREEVLFKLNELENNLYSALNNGVSAVKTLGFFAQNQENIVDDFDKIGKGILESNPLVDVIQYLDSGTIVAVYPLAGNETVIGYNVLADPTTNKEVMEAVLRKDVFFSGPIHLKQGGVGIVGRYPIFENEKLKGLSAIIIYMETIFEAGKLNDDPDGDFTIKLTKINPNTRELENYIPSDDKSIATGFLASSPIDIGNWTLSVQLKKSKAFSAGLFTVFLRFILSFAVGYLAWILARQPALLRKKVEEQSKEILEANERFELATKATSDVIWDWDLTSNKVFRSAHFFKMFGYQMDERTKNHDFWKTIIHPEDAVKVSENLEKTLRSDAQFWEQEFRVKRADDTYAYIIDKGYIQRDDIGAPIRMIGATQDISKRKKAEIQVMEANQSLANANEELKVFAFLASHDLREPLRMISSFMSLLEKKYSKDLDAKANQYINFAIDGSKRLTTLINDLLEYSKVGFHPNSLEKINANELVKSVLELKSDLIRESNAKIIVDDLPAIMGIKTPIQILFQNLIGNSLKYRKTDTELIIKISGRVENDFLEFSVEDNGIGIEGEYLEFIFGILNRVHPKEKYPGTGMGLATCRKIVTQHGGKIWVESTLGAGSKFLFTLKNYG
ncbi:ATP-binding protein [Algoriphagus boritolerans]|uniref:histidine kinase n=1 Tax=Algoriphagus boritolerans DSM 17298 = JCM 18970 TaxID=1120964 RepID=A0A1H5VHM8_9BACT|nr:ATP-binding protein [Algoriphagus boritolerans]SEF86730.1 PAS domain S-box-containing protein [Algoriphagus boritolerans DSM 17298 = JCM 18970]